mgnify:CR=1 FL=1
MKAKGISLDEYKKLKKKKTPKYRNVATTYNGIRFQSKAECERYKELELLQKAGHISYFLRQAPFDLPGGIKYYADFMIIEDRFCCGCSEQLYEIWYEDVKSKATANNRVFINKVKQVKALYNVDIEIIIK